MLYECLYTDSSLTSPYEASHTTRESTMSFELICHLVDLSFQPGVSGELIHHVDSGQLLLHVLDLGSHLGLLLCILLQHPGHLVARTAGISAFPRGGHILPHLLHRPLFPPGKLPFTHIASLCCLVLVLLLTRTAKTETPSDLNLYSHHILALADTSVDCNIQM